MHILARLHQMEVRTSGAIGYRGLVTFHAYPEKEMVCINCFTSATVPRDCPCRRASDDETQRHICRICYKAISGIHFWEGISLLSISYDNSHLNTCCRMLAVRSAPLPAITSTPPEASAKISNKQCEALGDSMAIEDPSCPTQAACLPEDCHRIVVAKRSQMIITYPKLSALQAASVCRFMMNVAS